MSRKAIVRSTIWVVGLCAIYCACLRLYPPVAGDAPDRIFWLGFGIFSFLFSVAVWVGRFIQHIVDPKAGDSRVSFIWIICFGFAAMAFLFLYAVQRDWNKENLGSLGDFFGGIINPVLTFLTFIGLLVTIVMQQREVHRAKEEAKLADEARRQDRELAVKQQFEATFFQMMSLHDSIVNAIDLRSELGDTSTSSGKEWHGRDCFARFYEHLRIAYRTAKRRGSGNPLREGYDAFWKRDQKDLGHYFRFLYNMIRVIDENSVDTRTHMRLVRAQLSDYELLIIFYNGIGPKGAKFRDYIVKYTLFDNLPEELLLEADHLDFYLDGAYFDHDRRKDPKTFLEGWCQSYIYAESRTIDDFTDIKEELLADAKREGITHSKLNHVANGTLDTYLWRALKTASGEEEIVGENEQ